MESKPLVVVGAGVSGTTAAIEAARAGVQVTLIDENPIGMSMIGLDVPQFFGQRIVGTLRNKAVMLGRVVVANDALAEAEEAGVDIQLGTYVWGAFRNTESSRVLDGPQLGLADDDRSWLMKYDRLIVAAGSRDLGMSFAGWNMAGAMGANGAYSLMSRYQALSSQRMVVLGSGNLGLNTARMAQDRGIDVAAVVDVSPSVRGDEALMTGLQGQGVELYNSHTVKEAAGKADDIESVVLVEIDDNNRPVAGSEKVIPRRHRVPRYRPGAQHRAPQSPGLRPCLQVRAWRVRAGARRLDADQRRYGVRRGRRGRLPRRNGPGPRDRQESRPPGRGCRRGVAGRHRQRRGTRQES